LSRGRLDRRRCCALGTCAHADAASVKHANWQPVASACAHLTTLPSEGAVAEPVLPAV
jgi:hypothetical protein